MGEAGRAMRRGRATGRPRAARSWSRAGLDLRVQARDPDAIAEFLEPGPGWQRHGLAPVLVTWAGFLSLAVVLVVTAPPVAGFVAAERRPVEPLVHAPEAVEPARVRGVGVVDGAILEGERAHAGTFSPVRLPVRSDDARCELVEPGAVITGWRAQGRRAEVVLDGTGLPLLRGVRGLEVVVEVAAG